MAVHGFMKLAIGLLAITSWAVAASGHAFGAGKNVEDIILFQPHQAVYEVRLERAAPGSTMAALDGRMIYELSGNLCDGYKQVLRFVTRATNQEGNSQLNDVRTTMWENVTSETLKFDVQNYHDSMLVEATQGAANRAPKSGAVRVKLTKPSAKTIALEKTTLFPIAHSKALLRAALSGAQIFPSGFYDGSSDGETVYRTTAAIGKRINARPSAEKNIAQLSPAARAASSPGWPIAMSYYNADAPDGDGIPEFEMSYTFHLNGVTSAFVIDHGDFAFKGELTRLNFTAPAGCRVAH